MATKKKVAEVVKEETLEQFYEEPTKVEEKPVETKKESNGKLTPSGNIRIDN
jgi:hypothetical protein